MNTTATPALTPYDTGDRLEPHPWTAAGDQAKSNPENYGKVDFDTDEGTTALTVHASRNEDGKDGGGYTLHIGNVGVDLAVECDETVPVILVPSAALREKVQKIISDLRTPIEQEEAEVYWANGHEALILVPGEKHVRKQQLIIVSEGGGVISAKAGSWGHGVRDTRIG